MPPESFPTQAGCCHTPFPQKKSPIFILHFNRPPLCLGAAPPPLFPSCRAPVGLSDNGFEPGGSLRRCRSAPLIRPHHEDICATLINERVALPPNLPSPVLSCPSSSRGRGLPRPPRPVCPCATAAPRPQVSRSPRPSVDSSFDFTFIRSDGTSEGL